jgi:outer membrane protein TolC
VQRAARAAAIKKARAVRLARERRIAARRAAAARRAKQTPTASFGWNNPQTNYSYDSFNNSGFGNATSTKTRQPAKGL